MSALTPALLLNEVRLLIDSARERTAAAVNAELTLLYWRVGRCIHAEVLGGVRAEYGQQVIASLAKALTADYGRGWSEQQLRHCLRVAEIFTDEVILSAARRELSWTHIKGLCQVDDMKLGRSIACRSPANYRVWLCRESALQRYQLSIRLASWTR